MSLGEIEFPCVCHSGSALGKRVGCIYILHDNHASVCVCVCVCVCVGVCSSGHTEAYVNLYFTKTLRAAYDPSSPPPTSTPTPCVTDDTRHRYEISADTDAAEHAAPIEEKSWKTEDRHSRHTSTALKWNLHNARNLLATRRWRSVGFTSPARRERNLWCPRRWGWGIGCSWKWHCVFFPHVSKDFLPR